MKSARCVCSCSWFSWLKGLAGCLLNSSAQALAPDLRPGRLFPFVNAWSEPVLDAECLTKLCESAFGATARVSVAPLLTRFGAVIYQDRMDPVGHSFQRVFQEIPCRPPWLLHKLDVWSRRLVV